MKGELEHLIQRSVLVRLNEFHIEVTSVYASMVLFCAKQ